MPWPIASPNPHTAALPNASTAFPRALPPAELLTKILKVLFDQREAELVSLLPIRPFTVKRAAGVWRMSESQARKIPDGLAEKALLVGFCVNGEMQYVLPPPMAGFFEFSMMRIREDIDQHLLVELFYQYLNVEEDFVRALFTEGQTQLGRAFVHESALSAANRSLASEITRRKKAEAAIQNAHDELEKLVAERTKEIRLLKDRLQAENVFLKQELAASHAYGTIIGDSHPIKTVISQIELVASTDANVLIHGESGTGKELVAREIHKRSSRKEKPLIKVNCATIPKEFYGSEFFGHVKGSFTGAVKDRIGRFEAADGGTIFLVFNHWPPILPRSFPES